MLKLIVGLNFNKLNMKYILQLNKGSRDHNKKLKNYWLPTQAELATGAVLEKFNMKNFTCKIPLDES